MHILSSPTDSDLALYNIAKTSQKEVSAATAELSSAESLLHASQSAPNLIPDFSWSCVLSDPLSQHPCYCNPRDTCSLQAFHHSAALLRGFDTASF